MKFKCLNGATPLEPEELEALIPKHVTNMSELNEFEQNNIIQAETWISSIKISIPKILTIDFLRRLHKKMFNKTWKWAGQFRKTAKNIGVDVYQIQSELKKLFDDVEAQIKFQSYCVEDIAIRFHQRLTKIHPFINGNGRHARLMTDVLLTALEKPRFTWGSSKLDKNNTIRKEYIGALHEADKGNYERLLRFVRK